MIENSVELVGPGRIPRVLTVAGSDPSGGAGIEADIKTITALGCYGLTCVSTLTVQNTMGVYGKNATSYEMLEAILEADFADGHVDAVKVGVMTPSVVEWFNKKFDGQAKYLVIDPIISSSSGFSLAKQQLVQDAATSVYSRATLLTPNFDEALAILKILGTRCPSEYGEIAKTLAEVTGCRAVLLKGGHMPVEEDDVIIDILYDSTTQSETVYRHPRITGAKNTHGTGCTLSSAIASYLALGHTLQNAVKLATIFLHQSMQYADSRLGRGTGPLNHVFNSRS